MEMEGFVHDGKRTKCMGTGVLAENYKFLTCAHNIRQLFDYVTRSNYPGKIENKLDPFLTATQIRLYFGMSDNIETCEPDVILNEEDIKHFHIPEAYTYGNGPTNPDDFASIDLSRFKDDLPSKHFYLGDFSNSHHELCGKKKYD